jgi:hypothetical protein
MDDQTKQEISELLKDIVLNAAKRTKANLKTDLKPFHTALLGPEIIKLSSFERSFSTSFGQKYVEEIAKILALASGAKAERQRETVISLYQGANDEIENIIDALKSNKSKPDWASELKYIAAHDKGRTLSRKIISDLWMERDGEEHFFSIKTVKPNLDQTRIAKQDMLLLKGHNPAYKTYFALYYNPTGETQHDYTVSTPNKYFDMKHDSCVLIGKDFWDFVGGPGTYEALLKIFDQVGEQTIEQVKQMKL